MVQKPTEVDAERQQPGPGARHFAPPSHLPAPAVRPDLLEELPAPRMAEADAHATLEHLLLKLSDALRPLSDPAQVHEAATRTAKEVLRADRCYYCEIEDGKAIIRRDASREDLPSVAGVYPLDSLPIFERVLAAGKPFVVRDAHTTDLLDEELRQLCIDMQIISFVDVPLTKGGQPVGVLCVTQCEPRDWTEREVTLAVESAERTWAAVERARAETSLRESERRLRALVSASSDAIYRMSPDWNEMGHLVGRNFIADQEEPNPSWLEKYIPKEDQAQVLAAIAHAIQNKTVFQLEHQVLRVDGSLGWTLSRAIPLMDERGEITEWFGAASDITARKHAEEALRENQASLQSFYDSSPLLMGIAELDGERTVAISGNRAVAEFFGRDPEALPGQTGESLGTPPEFERLWVENYRRSQREGRPVQFDYQVRLATGNRWLSATAAFIGEGPTGRPRFSFVVADITARKATEQALLESETRHRALFETMDEGVCLLEKLPLRPDGVRDYRYLSMNPAMQTMFHIPDLSGRTIREVFPDENEGWYDDFDRVLETGEQMRFVRESRPQGMVLEMFVTRLEDESGLRLLAVMQDVTERKRAEEWQNYLLKLSDALRPLTDPVRIQEAACRVMGEHLDVEWAQYGELDLDRKVITITQDYYRGGRNRGDLPSHVGVYSFDVYPSHAKAWCEGRSFAVDDVEHDHSLSASERAGLLHHEVRAILSTTLVKNGVPLVAMSAVSSVPRHWTKNDIALLQETADRAWAAVERGRAEAALRKANLELAEADRRKNDFLAVLSHELRNPLAPIANSLHVLDHVPPSDPKAERAKQVIGRQVAQLSSLVNDLLDVTRIERNKVQLQNERVELNELVRRAVEDNRFLFERAGVELELFPAKGPAPLLGDRTRLTQVVGNILQNAAKFTGRGGRTRVSVNLEEDRAVMRIADDGVGISREVLECIFEPFSQAEQPLDRSTGGLGLGLALVKGLVELHGGSVEARSEGIGRGAEIIVRLPLDSAAPRDATAQTNASQLPSRRRVLIIEDNPDAADTLGEALALSSHQIAVAHGGLEGIAKAREFKPDVVLCDIGLPDMDGYAVARAFRADETLKHTFLVALSGYARPEDLERATQAGFSRHLAKPPSLDMLEQILSGVSSRPVRGGF